MANYNVKTGTGGTVVSNTGGTPPALSVTGGGTFQVTNSDGGTLTVTFYDGVSEVVRVISGGAFTYLGATNIYYSDDAWIRFDYVGATLTINGEILGPVLSYIPTGYPIAFSDLKSFFGSAVNNLHAYYRGGGIVQNITPNNNITNSVTGNIELSDFINSAKTT